MPNLVAIFCCLFFCLMACGCIKGAGEEQKGFEDYGNEQRRQFAQSFRNYAAFYGLMGILAGIAAFKL